MARKVAWSVDLFLHSKKKFHCIYVLNFIKLYKAYSAFLVHSQNYETITKL